MKPPQKKQPSPQAAQQKKSVQARAHQPDLESRFPESGNPVQQLLLLWKGCRPALRLKCRNRIRNFLDGWNALLERLRRFVSAPRFVHTAVFLAASVSLAALSVYTVVYTTATTVTFEGVELGTVASEDEVIAAKQSVEHAISQVLGYNYTMGDGQLAYSTGLAYRSAVVGEEELEAALNDTLRVVEHGFALYIDGEFVGATQTEGALDALLEQVSAPYRGEETISIDFMENVEIRECDLPVEKFTNLGDTALLINGTKEGEITYTVKSGDCWSVIAQDHNLTNDELLKMNSGYDIDKLQIGDVLLISNAVPYLTVTSVQLERYTTELPYEIEYVDDDSMYIGDFSVISAGEYGSADIVARVTYEGFSETSRVIESETILKEPVTEVQARGTLERPTWLPSGSFRWPTSGTISSKYGYRNIFGGTSFHGGLDIANSYGTDVVAADGGTIIYAGWMNGYGNLVQIDHGNGYVTYYGHNSSLLVSVGDKVYKGQHIAEMGSTGNSTGNHCHFEVRLNGERQNPINYLP
ncbi:MAG: M23 family metallopeptidase [Oscillospiraceae bacterium]|nr:M23 family metallopeptidase [Oscillospiraceae bacterium]